MPETFFCMRRGDSLHPVAEDDLLAMQRLPQTRPIRITATVARSMPQHRFYFALLRATVENLPHLTPGVSWPFNDVESLDYAIRMEVGFVRPIKKLDGTEAYIPRSLKLSKCDGLEFHEFLQAALDVLRRTFYPGKEDMKEVIRVAAQRAGLKRAATRMRIECGDKRLTIDIAIKDADVFVPIEVVSASGSFDLRGIIGERYESLSQIREDILERLGCDESASASA